MRRERFLRARGYPDAADRVAAGAVLVGVDELAPPPQPAATHATTATLQIILVPMMPSVGVVRA